MKLAWASDVHLNFVNRELAAQFCMNVRHAADGLLIGGDIAESVGLEEWLEFLAAQTDLPIYFVLGNHDYYRGSYDETRHRILALNERSARLHWLDVSGVVHLSEDVALAGVGGWADGRYGDYAHSTLLLNDYFLIREFVGLDSIRRLAVMQAWAGAAAGRARQLIEQAFKTYQRVLFLTHYPPFLGACLYQGRVSDDHALPHFASKVMGDMLMEVAAAHPRQRLDVYCGHTHDPALYQAAPNLTVRAAAAEYGVPQIQEPLIDVA